MRITIVTVCHKSSQKIAAYTESFLKYHSSEDDRTRYQFVFVENSGDSELRSAVKPLVQRGFDVLVLDSPNEGFGRGCNKGALHAKGELLIFVNPDIRFLGNLGALQAFPLGSGWGTVKQVTPGGATYAIDLLPEYKGLLFEVLQLHRLVNHFPNLHLRNSYVVGSFMIVTQELFLDSGGFNPAFFLYHEEAELARRLHALNGPPIFCQDVSVFHEGFGSHTSRQDILRHEADGFVTYCQVTQQPALLRKRMRILKLLGLISPTAKTRQKILSHAAAQHSHWLQLNS